MQAVWAASVQAPCAECTAYIRHSAHAMSPHCNESPMKMDGAHVFPSRCVTHRWLPISATPGRHPPHKQGSYLPLPLYSKCLDSLPTRPLFALQIVRDSHGLCVLVLFGEGAAQRRKSGPQDERGKFTPFASACAGQAHRKANRIFPFQCRSRPYRRTQHLHHLSGIRPCLDCAKGHG